jgi:HEPN domain-containing protein
MPPERHDADDPREWLRLAGGDLAVARAEIPGAPAELLCFHAQQAAEKAIKAMLISRGLAFPRTHDLDRLLDVLDLESGGNAVPSELRDAVALTDYAVRARYPFIGEAVTPADLQEALRIATAIVAWAESLISEA